MWEKLLIVALLSFVIVSPLIMDNKHTLRYDGEVNIGKILPPVLILSIKYMSLSLLPAFLVKFKS